MTLERWDSLKMGWFNFLEPILFVFTFWSAIGVILWAFYRINHFSSSVLIQSIEKPATRLWLSTVNQYWLRDRSILLLAIALMMFGIAGIAGYGSSWLNDLAPELVGLAVTILVIDRIYERRAKQQDKRRIIEQLGSYSNDFALDAVRIARHRGWLQDGSLRGAQLARADLHNADLSMADLRGANLDRANLQNARLSVEYPERMLHSQMLPFTLTSDDMKGANLSGACLTHANLSDAILVKANLDNCDLSFAVLNGANLIGVSLRGAILWRTFLWDVDLSGADLSDTEFGMVHMQNITYDELTILPRDFEPDSEWSLHRILY